MDDKWKHNKENLFTAMIVLRQKYLDDVYILYLLVKWFLLFAGVKSFSKIYWDNWFYIRYI